MAESFRNNLKIILKRPRWRGMRLRFPSLPQPALKTLTYTVHERAWARAGRPARANAAAAI